MLLLSKACLLTYAATIVLSLWEPTHTHPTPHLHGDTPATPLACRHLQFRILQSILTTELTQCTFAEHMHGCAHGERPSTDAACMGAVA